ncbi:UDP-N-acetylglucosamine diphosphorylase [Bifidobacterium saguini DSM 23967]|uniref:DUF4862 family protein n=3 Tax=Bifidobacterium TaxID=1678 RepID=A0A2N5ITY0_9BIFI|nr:MULTISPECIES: DUF4862 family protein [Bifidobacterium]KFI92851.1 UDP-N-acetylglucosamine diphosphorylase [Bifidobacterium saguini DSM 23967]PLS25387.1 UDP-N-acetylglucosamine diphosphorylase [Bifidobacterium imperatoris]QSY58458.1 DUF4862 family protein [Bifidobacterium imperatoris]QTB91844.1 DUF4862 family protein [Bifidobacterium saguini]
MPSFVVGAYASLPQGREAQEDYYNLLGRQPWIAGTELPFPGDFAETAGRIWMAGILPAHWRGNTITVIPGTMQHVWKDPNFGLASPNEDGRAAALAMLKKVRNALADFTQWRGSQDVRFVEVHSAPTAAASKDAMAASLEELMQLDWSEASLVIEHCDKYVEGQKPEKGFLPIEDEIELCREAGIGLTVNWGRSVVEGRTAATAVDHVRKAAQAGVLSGLMFSGAGPEETQYGYGWIDGHLPMSPDEPTSLMDAAAIADTVRAAGEQETPLDYMGAKVCVPKNATLEERLSYLEHIYDAVADATAETSAKAGDA